MSDRDNITMPHEVVEKALKSLESWHKAVIWQKDHEAAITALRTALAAPKQEPVAWMDRFGFVFRGKGPHETFTTPLYTAPSALAAETPKHPGYIIGSHWLETAYSRICAGEAEADVLRDCGWERVDQALRRDAERYRWLRDKAPPDIGDMASVRDSHDPSEIDAAIDAAMEASTAPASAAADSSTAPEAKP